MRRYLALGVAVALIGVTGCNNGSGKSKRAAAAAAAVTSGGTGGVTSNTGSGGSIGGGSSSSADAPQVTGLTPANGPVDGGTAVIISGTNFAKSGAGQTLVLFGTRAVLVTPTSDTSIQVTAPAQSQTGSVDVRVINDLGVDTLVGAFRYDPTSSRISFVPPVGSFDGVNQVGTKITLKAQGIAALGTSVTVEFGAIAATQVERVDPVTLVAEVPSGVNPGPTTITVKDGPSTYSAPGFVVQDVTTLAYGDLTINEICMDPGGQDINGDGTQSGGNNQTDEFVEIINTTANPIDLSHLRIRDGATTPNVLHRFPNPTTLPAGGAIVVFSGGTPSERFGARHATEHAQASTNGGLFFSNSSAETTVIEDSFGTVIFEVRLTQPGQSAGAGTSWNSKADGQRVTTRPATSADYDLHRNIAPAGPGGLPGAHSAGKKMDGSSF